MYTTTMTHPINMVCVFVYYFYYLLVFMFLCFFTRDSGADVYTCLSGATAALYGPSHGGANAAVVYMLQHIGSKANVPKVL